MSARAAKRAARGLDSRMDAFDRLPVSSNKEGGADQRSQTRPGSLNRKRSSKARPGKRR